MAGHVCKRCQPRMLEGERIRGIEEERSRSIRVEPMTKIVRSVERNDHVGPELRPPQRNHDELLTGGVGAKCCIDEHERHSCKSLPELLFEHTRRKSLGGRCTDEKYPVPTIVGLASQPPKNRVPVGTEHDERTIPEILSPLGEAYRRIPTGNPQPGSRATYGEKCGENHAEAKCQPAAT